MQVEAAKLRARILQCQACGLHETTTRPVPWRGPVPALVAVVAEAPGSVEEETGKPLVGPSGQFLSRNLDAFVKIPLDDMFICNTTSCRPPKNRTPFPVEREACKPNLVDQLALSKANWVLALGATALQSFVPTGKITRDHGIPIAFPAYTVLPSFHPAAALRNSKIVTAFQQDLCTLHDLLMSEETWPGSCIQCRQPVARYDSLGLGRCLEHS